MKPPSRLEEYLDVFFSSTSGVNRKGEFPFLGHKEKIKMIQEIAEINKVEKSLAAGTIYGLLFDYLIVTERLGRVIYEGEKS